jgi:glycine oxidase
MAMKTAQDCVVIGGGVNGLLSARELAHAGCAVTLIERGEVGREASWAAGGILSPLYPWRQPEAVTVLARLGQHLYPELVAALQACTGIDPEWLPSGLLILDSDEAGAARRWAARTDMTLEIAAPACAQALEPALRPVQDEAIWLPEVYQIRPPRLMRALRESLRQLGVSVREGLPATALHIEAGRIRGVRTPEGTLSAGQVVVAAGAWSDALLGVHGLGAGVEPVRGQMVLLRAGPGLLRRIVLKAGRYVIPRRDGAVIAGSTLERAGFDKSTTESARSALIAAAVEMVPALVDAPIEAHWAGLRPGSPRGIPRVGEHPQIRGLFVNTAQHRNGMLLAPACARLLADLMLDRSPLVAPHDYLPAPPGSALVVGHEG